MFDARQELSCPTRNVLPMSNTTHHSTRHTATVSGTAAPGTTAPDNSTTTSNLVRFPLSTLRAGRPVLRAAAKCRSMLRHPRSRVRVIPGWQAPSVTAVLPCGGTRVSATVHVSRHRITPRLWEELTGSPPDAAGTPMFFVTLSARVSAEETRSAGVRDTTVGVHSLFRRVLDPTGTAGSDGAPAWVRQDRCAAPTTTDGDALDWVWHALLTQENLESDGPADGPHSSAA